VKVTIILDFVDEVGLDYQASKLRHTINAEISTAGSRWEPDSGISAGNFCRKRPDAGSVNELSARKRWDSVLKFMLVQILIQFVLGYEVEWEPTYCKCLVDEAPDGCLGTFAE
jgi:hypothetical protein